jgi:Family of unknown function (DUF6118)
VSETDDGSGNAARAFEDLRAEVSVLRRAIESLPAAWKANQPPDYTPSLGTISNRLQEVTAQLQAIEGHPALQMTPEHHQQAIVNAGSGLLRDAAVRLDDAVRATQQRTRDLDAIIGSAQQQDQQTKWLIIAATAALIVGLLMSPILARLLPLGLDGRVAAVIMRGDRWDAGSDLMEAGNPEAWKDLMAALDLSKANREALTVCRDAAAKTKKEQHCTVVVPAPGAPRS